MCEIFRNEPTGTSVVVDLMPAYRDQGPTYPISVVPEFARVTAGPGPR